MIKMNVKNTNYIISMKYIDVLPLYSSESNAFSSVIGLLFVYSSF